MVEDWQKRLIVELMMQGKSIEEISERTGLSPKKVQKHLRLHGITWYEIRVPESLRVKMAIYNRMALYRYVQVHLPWLLHQIDLKMEAMSYGAGICLDEYVPPINNYFPNRKPILNKLTSSTSLPGIKMDDATYHDAVRGDATGPDSCELLGCYKNTL